MLEEPQLAQFPAQLTAVIRLTIPRAEIRKVMGPGIGELMRAVADQRIRPSGPWFTHHLRRDPALFDFEIGVPIPTPVRAAGRVRPGKLPAVTVARAVFRGPYDGLPLAWSQLDYWVEDQGHRAAANFWETYLVGPETDSNPKQWRTELNRPILDRL
jgi:effector-binding domain-containing protein